MKHYEGLKKVFKLTIETFINSNKPLDVAVSQFTSVVYDLQKI